MEREKQDKDAKIRIVGNVPLIELTLEEILTIDGGTESLLERLEVNKVIAAQDEDITLKGLFLVIKEPIYNYDFGDNQIVRITKYKNCEDLLKNNIIDEYELEEAEEIVLDKYKLVCMNKEGISVFDVCSGLSGFADSLGTIYEGEEKEEASSARAWAKSFGQSVTKVSNKMD